jgi:hypothetical protein
MTRPIREWSAQCPYCGQLNIFAEFKGDTGCPKQKCSQCSTDFVCSSYRYNCETCQTQEDCFEYPTVTPIIHKSTWRAFLHARRRGFKDIAWRDLECVTYLKGEEHPEEGSLEDRRLQLAQHNMLVTSFEVGNDKLVIWNPQPKVEEAPLRMHLGFFGRR